MNLIKSELLSTDWWRLAALRALYTAVTIAAPYLGGALIAEVPWLSMLLAAGLGFVASLLTSVAGIPEAEGVILPWWMSALERTVKTFCQALVAGFVGATLITDVAWGVVLQAAAIAALGTLLRFILTTLPEPPAAALRAVKITGPVTIHEHTAPRL